MTEAPEPWLRDVDLGVHPALAQSLFSLHQVREDVTRHTEHLTAGQIWATPGGLTPAGFHLRHLAGSTDRLTTYLLDQTLTDCQLEKLRTERTSGADRDTLLAAIYQALTKAEAAIRALDPQQFGARRYVGRQRIPTTAIGLAIHIAEHAQRHTGQIISACNLAQIQS